MHRRFACLIAFAFVGVLGVAACTGNQTPPPPIVDADTGGEVTGLPAVFDVEPPVSTGNANAASKSVATDDRPEPQPLLQYGLYQIFWGADAFRQRLAHNVEKMSRPPEYVLFFRDLSERRGFPTAGCNVIREIGATPIISLELWTWHGGRSRESFLPAIIEGTHDGFFRRWAQGAKAWGHRVLLRFGFEMNGDWFSWGCQPELFVKAWRHAHAIFTEAGADNVEWVWAPNNVSCPQHPEHGHEEYWPGDGYVDVLGLDGYNFGDHHDEWHSWQTFEQVNGPVLDLYARQCPDKPVIITETGCAPGTDGQRAAWIRDAYEKVRTKWPQVRAVVWFNLDTTRKGEPDWSLTADDGSLQAWNETFAAPLQTD